jgi:hypothetical protein
MSGTAEPHTAVRSAWVLRVLGVSVPSGTGTAAGNLAPAIAGWKQALATVDAQIAGLQALLRQAPDPELNDIAEFGLNAMTGNHKIKILAELMDIEAGRDTPQIRQRVSNLAGAFLNHIGGDPRIAACDANPFGVRVSLRATLTPALRNLMAALAV